MRVRSRGKLRSARARGIVCGRGTQEAELDQEAVTAALSVPDRHMDALNARDEAALAATLHFPHYRLSSGVLKIWEGPESCFADFLARAGDGWHHSVWNERSPVTASADKVRLDVIFTRCSADGSVPGQFRSLWVIALLEVRSSFAA